MRTALVVTAIVASITVAAPTPIVQLRPDPGTRVDITTESGVISVQIATDGKIDWMSYPTQDKWHKAPQKPWSYPYYIITPNDASRVTTQSYRRRMWLEGEEK